MSLVKAPPWFAERASLRVEDELPDRVEVAVVGGGLAGLAVASMLAEGGASVAVLEARSHLFDGISGREAGLVAPGLVDSPRRLVEAIGEEHARQIYDFTATNRRLIEQMGALRPGLVAFSVGEAEAQAVDDNLAVLEALGHPGEALDEGEVAAVLGGQQLGRGWKMDGGSVDPLALAEALRRRCGEAGVALRAGCPVKHLAEDDDVVVHHQDGQLHAEVVVLCAGAGLVDLDGAFAETLTPVRQQLLASGPTDADGPGFIAQMGYLYGSSLDGRRILGGARWATPHLEASETDDAVISDAVHEKLVGFAQRWFGVEATHAWSTIAAHTCDGLPIIGPLPGRSRVIACTGWGGRPHSLAMAGAQVVAEELLGRDAALPKGFFPGRFV